jgi:argininosuccinate lyase
MKLWEGRFTKKTDPFMEKFNRSLDFDKRLAAEDVIGSMAYAKALKKAKLISPKEADKILKGLYNISRKIDRLTFLKSDEDIHTAIERTLVKMIGRAGKKLHMGRSRNDQVALDSRIFLKHEIREIQFWIRTLMATLLDRSKNNKEVIIPGFTHLQMAQPVLLSHYLLSLFFMLERDWQRLSHCLEATDIMPLGSGALAGAGFDLDRNLMAKLLGFNKISRNSIDAVSDRDYLIEFLGAAAIIAMHLSRFAEDLIIFSSPGFEYFEISESLCTGSSMMPNKRNPDSLELIRGKTGRIYGNLMSVLTVLKGLPLTYNKDLQEDKEPLFDTVDTLVDCLQVFSMTIKTLRINRYKIKKALHSDLLATDLADMLSKKGVPFRDAHKTVGRIVLDCKRKGQSLSNLKFSDLKKYSTKFPKGLKLDFKESIKKRSIVGGTGLKSVNAQIKNAKAIMNRLRKFK